MFALCIVDHLNLKFSKHYEKYVNGGKFLLLFFKIAGYAYVSDNQNQTYCSLFKKKKLLVGGLLLLKIYYPNLGFFIKLLFEKKNHQNTNFAGSIFENLNATLT